MISTRENLKVELQQNLAYHEHRQQEEDALAELQQKQRELGGAAGADDIQAQVDDLNRKIEKARIEEAKTKGALEQVTSNVKQCQEELKERKYKTAEDVHRERLLDYKANSMAAADLDQYYKVGARLEPTPPATRDKRPPFPATGWGLIAHAPGRDAWAF